LPVQSNIKQVRIKDEPEWGGKQKHRRWRGSNGFENGRILIGVVIGREIRKFRTFRRLSGSGKWMSWMEFRRTGIKSDQGMIGRMFSILGKVRVRIYC
jgi:hypothetical protein